MVKNNLLFILAFLLLSSNVSAAPQSHAIVEAARAEIGRGEIGGDNKGPFVLKYTHGIQSSWCAGFVSYVLQKAGSPKLGYVLSAREYWNKGQRVAKPRPGDVICFWRGKKDGWTGHVGIVESVEGDRITTIEGNVGAYPAQVKRMHYTMGKIPKLLGFVRIV